MRWRQVALLWAVFAALLGQWWLVERGRPPAGEGEAPPRARFLELRAADVSAVAVERAGRRLVLRRDGGYWRVVEPVGAQVPSDLVSAFMEALVGAEEIEQVAATTDDARSFGFDEGAGRVELSLTGQPPLVVTLGGQNPTGTAIYARRGGAPGIVLIGRNVRYYEELLLESLPHGRVPAEGAPGQVGG